MQKRNALTTAPISKTLLLFALPTLGSSVLQSANGSINSIWVGRLIGENALAATTNGNLVMFVLTAFVFGFGMAATIMIGQAFGRGEVEVARSIVGTTIGAFIPVAILVAIGGWFLAPSVLHLLGTPAEIQSYALAFLRVTFVAMPAVLLLTVMMMALRGSGDSITPLWFMIMAVVLDITLNPILIQGMGPLPALGISGSALAMAIANYLSLMAMLIYIYKRDLPLRLKGPELRYIIPKFATLRVLFAKGLPIGTQMVVVSASMMAMMRMINARGVDTTAAFGATQQLWTYVQMPAMALGAAVSAMAAQNIGAGKWDRVGQITRAGIVFNVLMTGGLVVLVSIIAPQVLGLFVGADSPAIPIGVHIINLATWGFICFGVSMVLFGTIRANGQVIWPLIILFVSLFPVRMGFAYGMRGVLGDDALWFSFPAAMLATMVMAIALYRSGFWRNAKSIIPDAIEKDAVPSEIAVTAEAASPVNPTAPSPQSVPRIVD